jgi:hypothetical protein
MKLFLPAFAAAALSAVSLAATAVVRQADVLGNPAQASAVQRTIVINPDTKWVTVEHGEVIKFVANGREFAWAFNGMSSSFDLKQVAPTGALDRDLEVYIWPNDEDRTHN